MKLGIFLAAAILCRAQPGLTSADLYKLRSVGEVEISPDASRVAYAVINNDQPGRPYSRTFVMKLDSLQSIPLGGERGRATSPRWSRDGQWIAYIGAAGLTIADPDGTAETPLAKIEGTNHPLPTSGD